jgi:hypothetical protein
MMLLNNLGSIGLFGLRYNAYEFHFGVKKNFGGIARVSAVDRRDVRTIQMIGNNTAIRSIAKKTSSKKCVR